MKDKASADSEENTEYFQIRLCERIIGIRHRFKEIRKLCAGYEASGISDLEISVSPKDIEYERLRAAREAEFEGSRPVIYPDSYLETLSVYRKIAEGLLEYDILLVHASVIAVDGEAYMFTAKSGTGKSTHTRLWREYFKERAVMINDDKPLIRITDEGVTVYGTPWDGKHHLSSNTSAPLKAVCILKRDEENRIKRITKADALPMLCQQSYRPLSTSGTARALSLTDRLLDRVPVFRLECNMEPRAAAVAYEGIQTQLTYAN